MSAIDELVQALQVVHDELHRAATAAGAAISQADSVITQAEALGSTIAVTGLAAVKDMIESLAQQIHGAGDTTERAIGRAKAVADGT